MGVPASFHCRYDVISRSYLYKLAILPPMAEFRDNCDRFHRTFQLHPERVSMKKYRRSEAAKKINMCITTKMSIEEDGSIFDYHLKPDQSFDIDLFKRTLSLMEGTHNFSNFSKTQGLFKYRTVNGERYVPIPRTEQERTRTVKHIEVLEKAPPLPASVYPMYEGVKFIDVVIHGQSFLHNQADIKRCVTMQCYVS